MSIHLSICSFVFSEEELSKQLISWFVSRRKGCSGYLKTLASVGVCTARALGRASPPRALVIGVGGGALPAWLAAQTGAAVDAVELDAAVLQAATSAMGLPAQAVKPTSGAEACLKHRDIVFMISKLSHLYT